MVERKAITTIPVSVRRMTGGCYRVLTTYGTIKCRGEEKTMRCLDNLFVPHQFDSETLRNNALFCWARCDRHDFLSAAMSYGVEWMLAPGMTAAS